MARIEDFWTGDDSRSKATRFALTPLSWLYTAGWLTYLFIYKIGIKKPYKSSVKIVCVGNFVAGGTGKTPVIIHLAEVLSELGFQVVIGCSGYGSPRSEGATLAPEGDIDPKEWGDEPAEVRSALPHTPIVVGRGRVAAAKVVENAYPQAILLMDDGLQHMPLAKDVSIALDPPNPNQLTFPAGPYREPRKTGEKRVSAVIPNEEFKVEFSPVVFEKDGVEVERPHAAGLLTAIGQPLNVISTMKGLGIELAETKLEADHAPLKLIELDLNPTLRWIVTQKDWVKLRVQPEATSYDFVVARRSATVQPACKFAEWLKIGLG